MNKLLDDENEEDEAFWNQDALKEVLDHSFFCFLIVPFFFLFTLSTFCCANI